MFEKHCQSHIIMQVLEVLITSDFSVLLPGESHGRRSLGGYSPWGRKESNMTERLHFLSGPQFSIFKKSEQDYKSLAGILSILGLLSTAALRS